MDNLVYHLDSLLHLIQRKHNHLFVLIFCKNTCLYRSPLDISQLKYRHFDLLIKTNPISIIKVILIKCIIHTRISNITQLFKSISTLKMINLMCNSIFIYIRVSYLHRSICIYLTNNNILIFTANMPYY